MQTDSCQSAAVKNIHLVNTDLSGKPTDDILADIMFNQEGTKVLECPVGYAAKFCGDTDGKLQQFHISFQRQQCEDCPNKERCKAKIYKHVNCVTASIKAHENAN